MTKRELYEHTKMKRETIERENQLNKLKDYLAELLTLQEWLNENIKPLNAKRLSVLETMEKGSGLQDPSQSMPALIKAREQVAEMLKQTKEKFPLVYNFNPLAIEDFKSYLEITQATDKTGVKLNQFFNLKLDQLDKFHTFDFQAYLEKLTKARMLIDSFFRPHS